MLWILSEPKERFTALKEELQIYNEDKAGMVIWKGLGRKINVALISPSKAVWGRWWCSGT